MTRKTRTVYWVKYHFLLHNMDKSTAEYAHTTHRYILYEFDRYLLKGHMVTYSMFLHV